MAPLAGALALLALGAGPSGCSARLAATEIGVNLQVLTSGSEEIPFVDAFKMSSPWSLVGARPGGTPLALDADGWIKALAPGQVARARIFTGGSGHYPGGLYTLLYDGAGALEVQGEGVKVIAQAPGRLSVRVTPRAGPGGGIEILERETNPANPLRNIRMILPGFEDSYLKDPFYPAFLARLSPFHTIRFMPWDIPNRSDVVEWRDRRSARYETQAIAACCDQHAISGVALEYQIDLANRLGADPWFNVPPKASDDYVAQMASLVHARLRPDLHPYIEYGNELWNAYFKSDRDYIERQGLAAGLSADPFTAGTYDYIQRSSRVFALWDAAFGPDKGRIVHAIESKEGDPALDEIELAYMKAHGGLPDVLAVGAYDQPPRLMTWRPVTEAYYQAIARMTPAEVVEAMDEGVRDQMKPLFQAHAAAARKYGLDLVAYEGGQGLQMNAADPRLRKQYMAPITALFIQANRDPGMAKVYKDLFDAWSEAGGKLFLNFGDVAAPGNFGSWGLLEYQDQDPASAVKYKAVTDYIAASATYSKTTRGK